MINCIHGQDQAAGSKALEFFHEIQWKRMKSVEKVNGIISVGRVENGFIAQILTFARLSAAAIEIQTNTVTINQPTK